MSALHGLHENELDRYIDELQHVANRLTRSPHDAEDLAQETWALALSTPPRETGAIRRWLRVTSFRAAVSMREREAARRDRERTVAKRESLPSVLDDLARRAALQALVREVSALEEPHRSALRMHFLESRSYPEMARAFGVSEGTARMRVSRGLGALRDRVKRRPNGFAGLLAILAAFLQRLCHRPRKEVGLAGFGAAVVAAVVTLPVILGGDDTTPPQPELELAESERPASALRSSGVSARNLRRVLDASKAAASDSGGSETIERTDGLSAEGRVFHMDGTPAAGALVFASEERGRSAPIQVSQADKSGTYRVEGVSPTAQLFASKPGYERSDWILSESIHRGGRVAHDFHLRGAVGEFLVEVRDAEGLPVPSARVEFLAKPWLAATQLRGLGGARKSWAQCAAGETDERGVFATDRFRTGASFFRVSAPGHADAFVVADFETRMRSRQHEDLRFRVTLQPPGTLSGVVVFADGRPAAGAELCLRFEGMVVAETRANERGRYAFESLPPGRYMLTSGLLEPGRCIERRTQVRLAVGVDRVRNVRLPESGPIRGRALDASGRPLAGWVVYLEDPVHPVGSRPCWTDEDGRYAFSHYEKRRARAPYACRLVLCAPGSAAVRASADKVRADAGETVLQLRAVSEPASRVRGLIPLESIPPGAVPRMRVIGADLVAAEEVSLDLATGRWTSPPLVPGEYSVLLTVPTLGEWELAEASLGPNETVDLGSMLLPEPTRLRVHLVDSPGTPQFVNLRSTNQRLRRRFHTSLSLSSSTERLELTQDGFVLTGVPTGSYEVSVKCRDGTLSRSVAIRVGETPELWIAPECP